MLEQLYRTVDELPKERLLVLFGPPGSGKNYTGDRLARDHGYNFYDADTSHTPEQLEAIRARVLFTPEMRIRFFQIVQQRTAQLLEENLRVVMANAFINNRFRCEFLDRFPEALFVLIQAQRDTRVSRIQGRPSHQLPPDQAIANGDKFEPITIPYITLHND